MNIFASSHLYITPNITNVLSQHNTSQIFLNNNSYILSPSLFLAPRIPFQKILADIESFTFAEEREKKTEKSCLQIAKALAYKNGQSRPLGQLT